MAKLIDADVLKYAKFHDVTDWTPTEETSYQRGWNGAIDAIMRNAPIVDVVPVVRCKDCVFFHRYGFKLEYTECRRSDCHATEDGYCCWAERREDE